jgi:hydrogenase maturation protease
MPAVLVIGYGNPTRGDDRIGWVVAERLAEEMQDARVQVLARQQLTLDLAADLSRVERVVFIDAAVVGTPGEIRVERIDPATLPIEAFSHQLAPAALLECARTLYGKCPEAYVVSVAGRSFEFGDELSARVEAALPEALTRVRELTLSVNVLD